MNISQITLSATQCNYADFTIPTNVICLRVLKNSKLNSIQNSSH